MTESIVIELTDEEVAKEIAAIDPTNFQIVKSRGFDGINDVISVVAVLSGVVVRELSKVIVATIERKKSIRVIHKGTEIAGLSKEELIRVLEKLSEKPKQGK